jgi:hypothetical protein
MRGVVTVCNQINGTRTRSPEPPFSEVRERPVLAVRQAAKGRDQKFEIVSGLSFRRGNAL